MNIQEKMVLIDLLRNPDLHFSLATNGQVVDTKALLAILFSQEIADKLIVPRPNSDQV